MSRARAARVFAITNNTQIFVQAWTIFKQLVFDIETILNLFAMRELPACVRIASPVKFAFVEVKYVTTM